MSECVSTVPPQAILHCNFIRMHCFRQIDRRRFRLNRTFGLKRKRQQFNAKPFENHHKNSDKSEKHRFGVKCKVDFRQKQRHRKGFQSKGLKRQSHSLANIAQYPTTVAAAVAAAAFGVVVIRRNSQDSNFQIRSINQLIIVSKIRSFRFQTNE